MGMTDTSCICCSGRNLTIMPFPARTCWHLMHHYRHFLVVSLWISLGKQGCQQQPFSTSRTWLGIVGRDRDCLYFNRQQQQLHMSHVFVTVQFSKSDVVSVGKKMWKSNTQLCNGWKHLQKETGA